MRQELSFQNTIYFSQCLRTPTTISSTAPSTSHAPATDSPLPIPTSARSSPIASGAVVGTGTYSYAGKTHAEIQALAAARERAAEARSTSTSNRTRIKAALPPCTDALIAAGIHRVVASMADPNPKVSGRGFEQLRTAGVHVEVGRLEEQARRLNEAFARFIRHGVPLVTLKAAMTLDGKIAPPPAEALASTEGIPAGGWVTSEVARAHVQETAASE